MRISRCLAAALGAALLATGPLPARAGPLDQRIVAIGLRYTPDEITVVQGKVLEFSNLDVQPHDVVAIRAGANGRPAFSTKVIGTGSTVPIAGLEKLSPGVYDYTCTLHPGMRGTLFLERSRG